MSTEQAAPSRRLLYPWTILAGLPLLWCVSVFSLLTACIYACISYFSIILHMLRRWDVNSKCSDAAQNEKKTEREASSQVPVTDTSCLWFFLCCDCSSSGPTEKDSQTIQSKHVHWAVSQWWWSTLQQLCLVSMRHVSICMLRRPLFYLQPLKNCPEWMCVFFFSQMGHTSFTSVVFRPTSLQNKDILNMNVNISNIHQTTLTEMTAFLFTSWLELRFLNLMDVHNITVYVQRWIVT